MLDLFFSINEQEQSFSYLYTWVIFIYFQYVYDGFSHIYTEI